MDRLDLEEEDRFCPELGKLVREAFVWLCARAFQASWASAASSEGT